MIDKTKKHKKGSISEKDISTLLQRKFVTLYLQLELQKMAKTLAAAKSRAGLARQNRLRVVRYLKIIEKSGYQALPCVRYITMAGEYASFGPEYAYPQGVYNPHMGQHYLQIYGVPSTVNTNIVPYGQMGRHVLQYGGPLVNGVTTDTITITQAQYLAGLDESIMPDGFLSNLKGIVLDMAKSCTFPLPLLAVAFQHLIAAINAWEKVYGVNITNAVNMDCEMEAHESQQPIGDGKKRGKNIVWSKEMDKCLILELMHQANEGYKVDKGFKDQAYIEMLSKSGFSWNPMTKMVECSDQANPNAKGLQGKRIEMLDELSIVCGNDQATGEWACSAKDVNANYSKKTNDSEDEYSHLFYPIDNMVANGVGDIEGNEFAIQQGNTSSQKPTLGKRNHRSSKTVTEQSKKSKGAELVAETMVAVATNMARLADAYEKSKHCIDYLELYKAVMDVEELDINSRMTAFEYLNGDPIKATTFMIYPQDMRYLFLIQQLSQGGPDGI
ncbi:unnamed protein product [Camellia sinensis]